MIEGVRGTQTLVVRITVGLANGQRVDVLDIFYAADTEHLYTIRVYEDTIDKSTYIGTTTIHSVTVFRIIFCYFMFYCLYCLYWFGVQQQKGYQTSGGLYCTLRCCNGLTNLARTSSLSGDTSASAGNASSIASV